MALATPNTKLVTLNPQQKALTVVGGERPREAESVDEHSLQMDADPVPVHADAAHWQLDVAAQPLDQQLQLLCVLCCLCCCCWMGMGMMVMLLMLVLPVQVLPRAVVVALAFVVVEEVEHLYVKRREEGDRE